MLRKYIQCELDDYSGCLTYFLDAKPPHPHVHLSATVVYHAVEALLCQKNLVVFHLSAGIVSNVENLVVHVAISKGEGRMHCGHLPSSKRLEASQCATFRDSA